MDKGIQRATQRTLMDLYMTSATPEQQDQIRNDVKLYYTVILEMAKRGELSSEQIRQRVTVSEMFETTSLVNETMYYIGEQSTSIIAYDIIIDYIDKILNR